MEEALEALTEAAEQGHIGARSVLGSIYCFGRAVPLDYEKGMQFLIETADANHADAQCNLAFMCQQGIPFGPDASQACDLYTKAADQGHVGAIFNLACLYRDGQCDVEQDLVRAKELFEAAAAKGHAAALCGLAGLHDAEGDHIGSFKLYKRAATSGYSTALHNVACALRSGEGVERNMEMALKYFEAAAARGHGKAQYNVGCMNAVGQGTAVNLVHARACFERAQNLGFANASVALKKVEKKLKKTKTQHVQKTNQMFGQRVVLTDPHALDATRLQAAAAQSTSGTCVDFDSSAKCYVVELDDGAGRIKVPPANLQLKPSTPSAIAADPLRWASGSSNGSVGPGSSISSLSSRSVGDSTASLSSTWTSGLSAASLGAPSEK
mmetsp:Transcript_93391/g.267250  ORF Transcript_93391/g.267250 Transcript_93391/m.267250 type:complete len:382 (+) Transcript_93391:1161-2306(+)